MSFWAALQRCVGRFGGRRVCSRQPPVAEEPWSSWEIELVSQSGLNWQAVLCTPGPNEPKRGTLPPPGTHHSHTESWGSLRWASCLVLSRSVSCGFKLLVAHTDQSPCHGMESASMPEAGQELVPSPGPVLRLGPAVGRAGKQQQHLWDTGEPTEGWLRGSEPPPLPSLWVFFPSSCNKGFEIEPRLPRTAFFNSFVL